MKDRSKYGATKAPTLIAAVLMVAGGEGLARADEAADKNPAPEAAAPAAEAPDVAEAPAPAVVPEAAVVVPAETPVAASPPAPPPAPTAPVVPTAAPPAPPQNSAASSWFVRPPLTILVGEDARQFRLTVYGFVEADYIYDTTRSYDDAMGASLVARKDTYAGNHSRSQFSMRNSRLGFAFASPTVGGVTPTAVLEADFFGRQASPPATAENTYFNSPTFRVRHAYVKLETRFVDVLLGQTYDLFGWQNFTSPCSLQFLGLPNQLFSRNPQLRLSHRFNADGFLGVDIALAAVRPAQRDSQLPDGSGGVRIVLNRWQGLTTPGNVGTTLLPAGVGVSGIVRQFKVNAFTPPPVRNANSATGWGIAVDALLPIIPGSSDGNRSNRLTLTGSYVRGTGIADLLTTGGGASFPPLQNPSQIIPWPVYEANIDNGLCTFDADGRVHTINWEAFRIGLQYYLPPSGRWLLALNYTESSSDNMAKLYPRGGSLIELLGTTADRSVYLDANLFWDATPAIRLGISGQYTEVTYLDGNRPHNIRGMAQTVYSF